ncbi:MAG TPA: hypothetical protein ENH40_00735 [Nitrospirae bacterium]|nr:hypothetical protein [Nitrospirota bacterium]
MKKITLTGIVMLAVLFSLLTESKAEVYFSFPPVNIVVGSNDYVSGMQIDRYRQHRYDKWVWVEGYWQRPWEPKAVWEPGHWTGRHGKRVWIDGHWKKRPQTRAVWVPGHWEKKYNRRVVRTYGYGR